MYGALRGHLCDSTAFLFVMSLISLFSAPNLYDMSVSLVRSSPNFVTRSTFSGVHFQKCPKFSIFFTLISTIFHLKRGPGLKPLKYFPGDIVDALLYCYHAKLRYNCWVERCFYTAPCLFIFSPSRPVLSLIFSLLFTVYIDTKFC